MIPYGKQEINEDDIDAVAAALRLPFLTQGPLVGEFEQQLAHAVGARYAVALNSGTAALHAAYFAAEVGVGSSILTSPITFVATANASLYLGGSVEFVDVDPHLPVLTRQTAGASNRSDIRALVPVHFGGHVCDLEELFSLAKSRRWFLIEDAAHALGARYRTKDKTEWLVGGCAHSDMCCFSFHPVKHVTTGEGGAVTTNNEELYRKLRLFRSHGITREPGDLRKNEGPWYYEQHALGFNYRITDFQSALGVSQLSRLPQSVERRRSIAARYDGAFRNSSKLATLRAPNSSYSSYHLYVIRVPAKIRLELFQALREAGIGVNVHYIPVHRQPYYRDRGFLDIRLPNAENYYAEAITLPMYPGLTDTEVDYVITHVLQNLQDTAVIG